MCPMRPSVEAAINMHPIARVLLGKLRDENTPNVLFRQYLHHLSMMMAIQALEGLHLENGEVTTPLGVRAQVPFILESTHAFVPIMRAGQGMLGAFQEMIPGALVWHMDMDRDEETHRPNFRGSKVPKVISRGTTCYVLDPMLATGGSACAAVAHLKKHGAKRIIYVAIIAANAGAARLNKEHRDVKIHVTAIDPELNENAFIVPGLGDAGDRQWRK
ncbi:uracil phosphoribosyltransferase [Candidatus Uhrbacteria bacterium]|jgi:uracil phosphoribosyltransferase|nr:uracil phosphoribosyltransferase [Candidatus Uhrbacteria bacterium]